MLCVEAQERRTPGRGTGRLLVLLGVKHTGITVEPISAEERLRLKLCWAWSGGCKPEVCGEKGSGGRTAVLGGCCARWKAAAGSPETI